MALSGGDVLYDEVEPRFSSDESQDGGYEETPQAAHVNQIDLLQL
jgi:hypothetical protein